MSLQPIMSISQTVAVESSTPTSVSPSINPVLQAALSSIDVQLEEELSRYRRQKAGRPVTPVYGLGSRQTRKSIDLISLEPIANQTVLDPANRTSINSVTPSQNLPFVTTGKSAPESIEQSLANASEHLSFNINKTTQAPSSQTNTATYTDTNTSAQSSQPAQADLVHPSANAVEPDDYLASSEQLLRSLAEEELKASKQRNFVSNFINPLSIGLLLLILFSSATVGFILMNPSIISNLGLDKVWKSRTPSIAQIPTPTATVAVPTPVTTATSNQPINAQMPNGPNLASEEFVELNLNTLSGLKTSNSTRKAPVSLPTAPSQTVTIPTQTAVVPPVALPNQGGTGNSNLAAAILPPSLQPAQMPNSYPLGGQVQVPYPPYGAVQVPVQPQMAPINQYPQPAQKPNQLNKPTTQPQNIYYVLTNNSDRTLKLARKIVANAQARNFPQGSRIVLGTFNQRPQAQVFVDKLQKQGISAWVYQP